VAELNYHRKTFFMLGFDPLEVEAPSAVAKLVRAHRLHLPAAYAELCRVSQIDELLHQYSNTDSFFLHCPHLVDIENTGRGLRFMSESQGNFQLAVLCDAGDDPPVYYRDYTDTAWIVYCDRFSDAIHTQVFDWQFLLREFPGGLDLDYEAFRCPWTDSILSALNRRATAEPTTHWFMGRQGGSIYRYSFSADKRVKIEPIDGTAHFEVTGRTREDKMQAARDLQACLKEEGGLDVSKS
jgi:hypothetical protein